MQADELGYEGAMFRREWRLRQGLLEMGENAGEQVLPCSCVVKAMVAFCAKVFFFLLAPFDRRQVRDEGPSATAIYGLRGGFRAAGGLGRVPPCVGKELVQVGLWAISELSGGGELKERGREGALGCDSQEAGPARHPGGDGRRPQQARHGSGAMACKEAQELHGLAPKPAADLNPDDNQAAASGVAKFGVRLMPLATCRICHRATRLDVGARVCLTKT